MPPKFWDRALMQGSHQSHSERHSRMHSLDDILVHMPEKQPIRFKEDLVEVEEPEVPKPLVKVCVLRFPEVKEPFL